MTVGEDNGYPAIYYQTIRDLGIDPVVCGGFVPVTVGAEGSEESGSARAGRRPAQLAEKALAKASGASVGVARKRAPRKATGAGAGAGAVTKTAKMANAKVPAQTVPAKTARGTARVASSSE